MSICAFLPTVMTNVTSTPTSTYVRAKPLYVSTRSAPAGSSACILEWNGCKLSLASQEASAALNGQGPRSLAVEAAVQPRLLEQEVTKLVLDVLAYGE